MLMCAVIKTNYVTQARAHTHTYILPLLRIILALLLLLLLSFMEQSRTIKYPHLTAATNQRLHFRERAPLLITCAPQDPMLFALPTFHDFYHCINLLSSEVQGFRFVCHYYHCYCHHGMLSFPKQISSHFDVQPLLPAVGNYEHCLLQLFLTSP